MYIGKTRSTECCCCMLQYHYSNDPTVSLWKYYIEGRQILHKSVPITVTSTGTIFHPSIYPSILATVYFSRCRSYKYNLCACVFPQTWQWASWNRPSPGPVSSPVSQRSWCPTTWTLPWPTSLGVSAKLQQTLPVKKKKKTAMKLNALHAFPPSDLGIGNGTMKK